MEKGMKKTDATQIEALEEFEKTFSTSINHFPYRNDQEGNRRCTLYEALEQLRETIYDALDPF